MSAMSVSLEMTVRSFCIFEFENGYLYGIFQNWTDRNSRTRGANQNQTDAASPEIDTREQQQVEASIVSCSLTIPCSRGAARKIQDRK
jgi:hypothetical protein